jgi:hypothetical protein
MPTLIGSPVAAPADADAPAASDGVPSDDDDEPGLPQALSSSPAARVPAAIRPVTRRRLMVGSSSSR